MESIVTKYKLSAEVASALYSWRDALLVEKAAELKEAADSVNVSKSEYEQLKANYDLYTKNAQEALFATAAAIANPKLNDKATVDAISVIVSDLQVSEKEKQRAALLKKIEETQTELANL